MEKIRRIGAKGVDPSHWGGPFFWHRQVANNLENPRTTTWAGRDAMRRVQHERKKTERRIQPVKMPVVEWGICSNKYCENHRLEISLELGDNMCVSCYDRGIGRRKHGKLTKTGIVRKVKGGTDEGHTDTSVTKRENR